MKTTLHPQTPQGGPPAPPTRSHIAFPKTVIHILVALLSAAALLTGTAAPASASATLYYKHPANTLSALFNLRGCHYKVIYGNFGGNAFAQVRAYVPSCGTTGGLISPNKITVYGSQSYPGGSRASCTAFTAECTLHEGREPGCGQFIWWQTTLPGYDAAEMAVHFTNGQVLVFGERRSAEETSGTGC